MTAARMALLLAALQMGACAPRWSGTPTPISLPVVEDSLYVDPGPGRDFDSALLTARWHLLRALDERSGGRHEGARGELDHAFHILASLQDSPYLEILTPVASDKADLQLPPSLEKSSGRQEDSLANARLAAAGALRRVETSVEEAYLTLLPHLEGFSPDSPLSLLLRGMSEEKIEDLPPDASQIVRIHQLTPRCSVPIDANAAVAASIHFFQTRGHETFAAWTKRSGRYRDLIAKILRDEELPSDLVYLAMIESGFNPRAYSRARAAGLWQFIRHTGRLEGLRIDHWVDERRDPFKSTRAAARHLKGLYAKLGDWRLASAAYNSGLGRVSRAMKKAGSRDFWKLELPRETRNYVPLFMAATIISKDPDQFGFDPVEMDAPRQFDRVKLTDYVSLKAAAKSLRISLAALRELNPELIHSMTPPGRRYTLHVPLGKGSDFQRRYDQLPAQGKPEIISYEVERGDNISSIAEAFGVDVSIITDANSLPNRNLIHPGQKLYIPMAGRRGRGATALHTVRRGESLSRIARSYNVTVDELKRWNGRRGDLIRPGEELRVKPKTLLAFKQRPAPRLQREEGGGEDIIHEIVRGESLSLISRRFGVTLRELTEWNQLKGDTIFAGQELIVGRRKTDFQVYKVVRGDTLFSIASRFGLEVEEIAQTNNMSVSSTLLTGMTLRIRSEE